MIDFNNIFLAFAWFAFLGLFFGLMLAIASRVFAVENDERVDKIIELLPGANCGGCGYPGCASLADAILKGNAKVNACTVCEQSAIDQISKVMGSEIPDKKEKKRAQVMCAGTKEAAKRKYIYEGYSDCVAAARLGGGDKMCPSGCLGYGTCVSACAFGAISVSNGLAKVDAGKCTGCGVCAQVCPKGVIKLIPYDCMYWVGCLSNDDGKTKAGYCGVGCIGCRICEKNCPSGAITVNNFVASIDYEKCTECGICAEKCPRKIIFSRKMD